MGRWTWANRTRLRLGSSSAPHGEGAWQSVTPQGNIDCAEDPAGWLHLHRLAQRPPTPARTCVSEGQTGSEMGFGKQEADEGQSLGQAPKAYRGARGAGAPMKIRSVKANNRRKVFEVMAGKKRLSFPFARLEVQPTAEDPIAEVCVDQELGAEGFTYLLQSGREGTVHIEDVLEQNQDPDYLRDLLLYQLTLEAQKAVAGTPLARREIIRRLGTSPSQLYRLLDQTNYRKSVDQMLRLLKVLDCDVQLVVRAKSA